MKTTIKTIAGIALLSVLLLTISCKEKTEDNSDVQTEQTETTADLGKEYTSDYVCPMHCEGSGSHEEGNCPKCGMAYVKNDDHMKDGHKH